MFASRVVSRHLHPIGIARAWNSSTHGSILMKPTKAPTNDNGLNMEEIKQRVESTDYSTIQNSNYRTMDNYYDETDPLHADMLAIEPIRPEGTLIWLLGFGDTHQNNRSLFQMLASKSVRIVIPNAPKIPVTALDDAQERAWFDIYSDTYRNSDEEDYEGIKQSMFRVHSLIHEEADYLGKILLPTEEDGMVRRKAGAARIVVGGFGQGGALALFSSIRYPHKLGGITSFSGFFPHVKETMQVAQEQLDQNSTIPNLRIPTLIVHGTQDQAIPWREFAKPRYIAAAMPPLSMPLELRPSHTMEHTMGMNELQGINHWVNTLVDKLAQNNQ